MKFADKKDFLDQFINLYSFYISKKISEADILSWFNDYVVFETYNSNAIEGNSYTLKETQNLILYNTTPANKPFKDGYDIRNYFEAYKILSKEKDNVAINEDFIKKLHFYIYGKVNGSGEYKIYDNVIGNRFDPTGDIPTCPAEKVNETMQLYIKNLNKELKSLKANPLMNDLSYENVIKNFRFLAKKHAEFEEIHPFMDGNGRTGRLLNTQLCIELGLCPFVINNKNRIHYIAGINDYRNRKKYVEHSEDKLASFFLSESIYILERYKESFSFKKKIADIEMEL